MTITVNGVNDTPVAVNDAYNVSKDTVLNIAEPGVLANDADADGDPLTAVLVEDVTNGSLTLNSNGSFTYTPNAGYVGTDSFSYKASDGQANSNTAVVTITITTSGVTFGLDSGDVSWDDSPNYLSAVRLQNTAGTGTLTEIGILIDDPSPASTVRLGFYSDDSGFPGSLLLDAGEVAVVDGWVTISGLGLPVTQDGYYWLVYSLNSSNNVRYQTGQAADSNRWAAMTYGPLPSQYPVAGSDSDSAQAVMRATVDIAWP